MRSLGSLGGKPGLIFPRRSLAFLGKAFTELTCSQPPGHPQPGFLAHPHSLQAAAGFSSLREWPHTSRLPRGLFLARGVRSHREQLLTCPNVSNLTPHPRAPPQVTLCWELSRFTHLPQTEAGRCFCGWKPAAPLPSDPPSISPRPIPTATPWSIFIPFCLSPGHPRAWRICNGLPLTSSLFS